MGWDSWETIKKREDEHRKKIEDHRQKVLKDQQTQRDNEKKRQEKAKLAKKEKAKKDAAEEEKKRKRQEQANQQYDQALAGKKEEEGPKGGIAKFGFGGGFGGGSSPTLNHQGKPLPKPGEYVRGGGADVTVRPQSTTAICGSAITTGFRIK
jgi:hypothetical protein